MTAHAIVPRRHPWTAGRWVQLAVIALGGAALALCLVPAVPAPVRAGIFLGACALILLLKRLAPTLFAVPRPRVIVDDDGVRRVAGARIVEQARWAELVKVSIMTTDEGPGAEDLFWLLHAADGTGCLVPHEQACEVDLLTHLQRLPGFDNLAVVRATGSTEWAEFVCWERSGAGSAAGER